MVADWFGLSVDTPTALSSTYFAVPAVTGSTKVLGINDDAVQTSAYADELVVSPAIDLSGAVTPYLMFDLVYSQGAYNGIIETLVIEASVDGGATWTVLQDAPIGSGDWQTYAIDLSTFIGEASFQFGFRYGEGC